MAFIQIVEFTTQKPDEVRALGNKYQADTEGKRTSRRVAVCADRDNPGRVLIIAEFDSYESAMENSNLPETQAMAAEMQQLLDGPPTFHNLDIVERLDE